jgi:hypothetical protein
MVKMIYARSLTDLLRDHIAVSHVSLVQLINLTRALPLTVATLVENLETQVP